MEPYKLQVTSYKTHGHIIYGIHTHKQTSGRYMTDVTDVTDVTDMTDVTDRQTHIQTNIQTNRQTDKQTDLLQTTLND